MVGLREPRLPAYLPNALAIEDPDGSYTIAVPNFILDCMSLPAPLSDWPRGIDETQYGSLQDVCDASNEKVTAGMYCDDVGTKVFRGRTSLRMAFERECQSCDCRSAKEVWGGYEDQDPSEASQEMSNADDVVDLKILNTICWCAVVSCLVTVSVTMIYVYFINHQAKQSFADVASNLVSASCRKVSNSRLNYMWCQYKAEGRQRPPRRRTRDGIQRTKVVPDMRGIAWSDMDLRGHYTVLGD
ncbi:MAG: hypothetical protein M1814_003730 [Vezdaea aestivalis]|nr:MAG: hypothetical protein M1814_003730 [Vezdaea aestivalis]